MSTPSSILRLELLGDGEQPGTWGQTTNTNLGTLLEAAIAGSVSVSVTSPPPGQALSIANYAPDQARRAIISLSTTTGANFNVYAPPVSKTYIIQNTSAYTATIYNSTVAGNTTAAGSGVAIPAGKIMQVWSNGTNFYKANTAVDITADVTGTLPVANGGTGVTSSTGTGSVVLSTSPTLVTPTLGAASATSVAVAAGAVGTPSFTATGDTDTGLWFPALNTIAASINGTEAWRTSSAGNLGVGTNNPLSRLHVSSGATDEVARFEGTGLPYFSIYDSGVREFYVQAAATINIFGETNKAMVFYTNSVGRFQLANDGAQSSVIPGGSTLYPQFACRAWINFDGTAVVSPASMTGVRGSGNISSVLDNGIGNYTINFTTAMPDTNYAAQASANYTSGYATDVVFFACEYARTTSSISFYTGYVSGTALYSYRSNLDITIVSVSIFR